MAFKARFGDLGPQAYQKQFLRALSEVSQKSSGPVVGPPSASPMDNGPSKLLRMCNSASHQSTDVVAVGRTTQSNKVMVVGVLQIRGGIFVGRFSYSCELRSGLNNDEDEADVIHDVLQSRHYPSLGEVANDDNGFSFFPDEILVQYPLSRTRDLKQTIRAARVLVGHPQKGFKIDIRIPARRGSRKDTDAKVMRYAIANANEIAHQRFYVNNANAARTSLDGTASKELAALLLLNRAPERIECFDISHNQGEATVGSRVVFVNGVPVPHLYRLFNVRSDGDNNDYASLEEVIERRFRRAWCEGNNELVSSDDPWSLPDLVVVDGGKGQLGAASKGMAKANVFPDDDGFSVQTIAHSVTGKKGAGFACLPVVALAKDQEQVFSHRMKHPLDVPSDSPALLLLRALRDESHRFALSAHRKRRSKSMFSV